VTRVLISTLRLLDFLEGGGHFWVYMQYADAFRRLGCEVHLLDSSVWSTAMPDERRLGAFHDRLARHGFGDRVIVAADCRSSNGAGVRSRFLGLPESEARDRLAEIDLLVNFNYRLSHEVVSAVRRTALIDIDPGLLQFWISQRMLTPAAHHMYFTTGETVGRPGSEIPDCGLRWSAIRPAVSLELWPYTYRADAEVFTTVSSWWGKEYVGSKDDYFDNNKRVSYLSFAELPALTHQPLELALYLSEADDNDRAFLQTRGWRVRHSREVADSPEAYQRYIQTSRGEFSCAKPSCARFANAWVSDRSLCYLASGKPVVAQYTGPSAYLPDGEGLFRPKTPADAARAFDAINEDYDYHCRRARQLAEDHFDAKNVAKTILERTL
jgi:hypothetical protein